MNCATSDVPKLGVDFIDRGFVIVYVKNVMNVEKNRGSINSHFV